MRIGIDGMNLALRKGTGVATYGFELAGTLSRGGYQVEGYFGLPGAQDPRLREILFFDTLGRGVGRQPQSYLKRLCGDILTHATGLRMREVPQTGLVEQRPLALRLPRFDRIVSRVDLFRVAHDNFVRFGRFLTVRVPNPPDIMHWTYPVPIRMHGARNVYTIHDLIPLILPYTTLDSKKVYYNIVKKCCETADAIITVSENSRNDIALQLQAQPEMIFNTYQSVSSRKDNRSEVVRSDDAGWVSRFFGLEYKNFFLFFGAIEPKKNVGRLIEAFLGGDTRASLVVVSSGGWGNEEDLKLLHMAVQGGRPGLAPGRLIKLDYLPRDILMRLVACAKAVVFPSLYEGFGLPVLEAMQQGTSVITSRISSLPEVSGGAAILIDPYDTNDVLSALKYVDDLNISDDVVRKLTANAGRFDEKFYIERLNSVYRGLVKA